jgi:hypothetical protein
VITPEFVAWRLKNRAHGGVLLSMLASPVAVQRTRKSDPKAAFCF